MRKTDEILKKAWDKPEVRKIRAGSAETGPGAIPDGPGVDFS